MKKICIVTANDLLGGYTTVINYLSKYFHNHPATSLYVITLFRNDSTSDRENKSLRLTSLLKYRLVRIPLTFIIMSKRLTPKLQHYRPNKVMCIGVQIAFVCLVIKFIYRMKFRLCVRLLNPLSYASVQSKVWGIFSIFKNICKKIVLQYADTIVVPSQGMAEELLKIFNISPANVITIYNGIDFKRIDKSVKFKPNDLTYKQFLKVFRESEFNIFSIGRLAKQKDFTTLIRAVYLLKQKLARVHLYIIGDGEEYSLLTEYSHHLKMQDHVHFLGPTPNVFYYLQFADLYVQSSLYEGFCIALIEAMYMGKPVISTDCPYGPKEILSGGKYGILVGVKNPSAIAEAVFKLTKDKEARKKYAGLAYSRAREFSGKKMAQKYERLFLS